MKPPRTCAIMLEVELRFPKPYRPSGHDGEPLGAPVAGFGFAGVPEAKAAVR
jgi:hypothetical protein